MSNWCSVPRCECFLWCAFIQTAKHLHEICSSVWAVFCQYQMVGGPWAWQHSGRHCYLWHSFYWIVYTERGSEELGGSDDRVGVWCPPSFSVSVASPLYLILPGHQLLPEWHLLRLKTLPLKTTPFHAPIHPSGSHWVPLWQDCGWWSQVHTVGMIAVTEVFFCSSAAARSYLVCFTDQPMTGALTGWQSNRRSTDWLTGQITWGS